MSVNISRIRSVITSGTEAIGRNAQNVGKRAQDVVAQAGTFVASHPKTTAGIAAGLGVLTGAVVTDATNLNIIA